MKKLIIIFLIFQSLICSAPGLNIIYIPASEPIKRVYTLTEKLQAIIWIETSGGNSRYNPGETQAVGLLQIWPIMVDEVNRIVGYQKYQYSDRNSDKLSIDMFWIYENYWNPTMDFETMARIWVSGPDGMQENNSLKYYQNAFKYLYAT
jgi:hypothetical protein